MRAFTSLPRPLLRVAAILFAAATVFYSALWMYYIRARPQAVIGIEYDLQPPEHFLRVTRVIEGSGAGAAGLQPGDLVRAIEGRTLAAYEPLPETVVRGRPGDVVRVTIERPGEPAPMVLPVVLGEPLVDPGGRTPARAIVGEIVGSFPVAFLVVGASSRSLRSWRSRG